jgi:hypothetical protein
MGTVRHLRDSGKWPIEGKAERISLTGMGNPAISKITGKLAWEAKHGGEGSQLDLV